MQHGEGTDYLKKGLQEVCGRNDAGDMQLPSPAGICPGGEKHLISED